jgi:transcriptional regulator with XRE-family HTH domain
MERGLSREQVAVGARCSYDTIRDIERGKTIPGALIAERLYLFFDVPVGTIMWGKSESPKSSVA